VISFEGRTAFVTGGSRGVGRATVLAFARAGADVALSYRIRREAAEEVAGEVRALGRKAVVVGGDHADEGTANEMAALVREGLGFLDVFVANAGIWPEEAVDLANLSLSRWRHTLAANLDGVFLTLRAALRIMRPGGSLVLVGSTAGQRGEAHHADYAASKGALISLTKSLAVEYAPHLTVNCVAPGWIDTDMSAGVLTPAYRAEVEAGIPLGRIASAEDVANPILFLASPMARHVTGEVLNVNGGSVLCG
jgi:3-oxoacyl-[acyl-carrier protein] reductase